MSGRCCFVLILLFDCFIVCFWNLVCSQPQSAAQDKELQSLKAALKARNGDIVELKLTIADLKKSEVLSYHVLQRITPRSKSTLFFCRSCQAVLIAKAEGMGAGETCNRCVQHGYATSKELVGVMFKNTMNRIQIC